MTRAPAEVGSAANSYEILAKLAMGGMAEIFLARGASAAGVERYVVLKRVLRHRASDVHFVQMFLDEARLAAQLNHPNIAQVYDIGKLGDSYFFTMEYVHGETVRNLLSRSHGLRRAIPFSSVLSIIAGAAAGLHHAHDRKGIDGRHLGIVHRDVSPSNLMVSYEGTVKVVDFGVAKAAHRSTETISGTVKGKISYMSPEQCRGNEIDRRSDLFSLGIVMWEMLTTEKLFRRASDFETMTAIVTDDIPPPSRLRPEIPSEIDHIVMRLLAKDPAQRYQNGDELHEAIEGVAVRTGSALSTASLGRYMRELFGQRPEPWIELQTQDQHPEAFTVTSEPIPNNLALSPAEEFDRKLSAVPALTQRLSTEPDPRPPQPTVPLRVSPELVSTMAPEDLYKTNPIEREDPQDLMATQAIRDSAPRAPSLATVPAQQVGRQTPMTGAPAMPMPQIQTGPMMPPSSAFTPDSGVVVARPHSPSVTPPSNPHYPIASSASHRSLAGQSPYPVAQRPVADQPEEPKRSRAMIFLIPAIAIGIVIGIALALGGGKKKIETASDHTTTMVATPEPGSASAAAEPPPPPPQPAVAPPAPEPTVPVAAAGSGEKPADEITMPEEPVAKPAKPATPKAKPEPDVGVLFKAGNYGEVVSTCSASSKVVAQNAVTCTVAACKAKQAAKAKKWFAQVMSAKKQAVQHDCDGVLPSDKPAVDPCKADPMACQH